MAKVRERDAWWALNQPRRRVGELRYPVSITSPINLYDRILAILSTQQEDTTTVWQSQ